MTTTTPPKLPDIPGYARLSARHNSHMGGPNTLTLSGTPDKPRLYADSDDDFSGISVFPDRAALVRFAREVLAFCDAGVSPELPPWQPASNGSGKRTWFLLRSGAETDDSLPLEDRYRYGANGNLVRYANAASAQRAADKLNAAE